MPSSPLEIHGPASSDMAAPRTTENAPARPRFRSKKKGRTGWIVFGVIVLAAATGGVAWKLRPVPVTTTAILRGTAVEAAYATGTVEPFDRVLVKAKAAGAVDLKVREGAHVKKGDVVAVIDSPTLQHDLDKGKAEMFAAALQGGSNGPQLQALKEQAHAIEADLHSKQADQERVSRLVATGAVPRIELDHLVDQTAALKAQLQANIAQQHSLSIEIAARQSASSAAVGSLAARFADTDVRSPIDGLVLARFVEPGEVAQVNTTLMKIGTADNLVLECAIDEADIGRVTIGKKVAISLYAFSDKVYEGEVYDILPDADRAKKSFLAKVKVTNPPAGLRSGMTAEVNVVIQERPGSLLLPAEAVDAAGHVLVVTGGRVQTRVPKLGVRDMLRVEVLDGLSEGDEVVVAGGEGLLDGTRVRSKLKPPADGMRSPKGGQAGLTL